MESWPGSTVKKNICHKKTIQYPAVYFGKLPQIINVRLKKS